MKALLLVGALCGIFYENSAIAKDQSGIVIFSGGTPGCSKRRATPRQNNEFHVKCSLGSNIIIDFNWKTATICHGHIEGDWTYSDQELIYKNKNINNNDFICQRSEYNPAFGLERLATYNVSSRTNSQSPTPMLLTYDVLSETVQVCVVPYQDMDMACTQERAPPLK